MQESQTAQSNTGLIYGLNDRPPVREAIFAAIQHLLAIFVAIITPPLIIAGALKLDLETTSFLVSMSLFASGISTFIQCRRIGGSAPVSYVSKEPVFHLSVPSSRQVCWADFH